MDSGTVVLCLGRPGDEELRAVVFLNFEMPRWEWVGGGSCVVHDGMESMKGVFVLPREIHKSKII